MEALTEQATLTSDKIDSLYYIVDIRNLLSILQHGILAHDLARQEGVYQAQNDISNAGVQKIRHDKKFLSPRTQTKRKLHEYANLYFQPHYAMMVVIQKEISREQLCVLKISGQILQDRQAEAVLTTKNAACRRAKFFKPKDWAPSPFTAKALTSSLLSGLSSTKWAGRMGFQASKQSRQSEALFPKKIEPHYIQTVFVHNEEIKTRISTMISEGMPEGFVSPAVLEHPSLFVSPRRGAFSKAVSLGDDKENLCRLQLDFNNEVKSSADEESDLNSSSKRARVSCG